MTRLFNALDKTWDAMSAREHGEVVKHASDLEKELKQFPVAAQALLPVAWLVNEKYDRQTAARFALAVALTSPTQHKKALKIWGSALESLLSDRPDVAYEYLASLPPIPADRLALKEHIEAKVEKFNQLAPQRAVQRFLRGIRKIDPSLLNRAGGPG